MFVGFGLLVYGFVVLGADLLGLMIELGVCSCILIICEW